MKKTLYGLMGLTMLFASCSTIEDREDAGPILTADQLVFTVKQPTAGSNTIILENKTPGTLQYWDWGTGFSNKLKDTIYIPFAGTFKIKFTAFCSGGTVTDSTTFTIAANDNAFTTKTYAMQKAGMNVSCTTPPVTNKNSNKDAMKVVGYTKEEGLQERLLNQYREITIRSSNQW